MGNLNVPVWAERSRTRDLGLSGFGVYDDQPASTPCVLHPQAIIRIHVDVGKGRDERSPLPVRSAWLSDAGDGGPLLAGRLASFPTEAAAGLKLRDRQGRFLAPRPAGARVTAARRCAGLERGRAGS